MNNAVKKYFSQLRPLERRLAVGVAVVVFLVLNAWLVWPHYSDWSNLCRRLGDARRKLALYHAAVAQTANYEAQIKELEQQGETVAVEDQAIDFLRTVQAQGEQSGVSILTMSPQTTRTNEFFVEQTQRLTVESRDQQLVDFLFKLGSTASMIRVRDLEMQPDSSRQHLNATIRLTASYQKSSPMANLKTTQAK